MPTFRHGRGTYVLIDQYNLTPYFREANKASTVDTAETSAFGTFDKTFVVGMREGRITVSGMFDGTTAAVDEVLNTILGQEAAVNVTYAPEGLAEGRHVYLCQSEETSHETTATISDVVGVTAELQGTGGVHSGVSLHDFSTLETATGNTSTGVDNGASTALGGRGILQVTTNTRDAGSIAVKIQDSPNNSTWSDLVTFTSTAFGVRDSQYGEVTGTVDQYLRALWTVTGGTTGSYEFAVSFARNNV